jgi:hypothetical protein
MPCHLLNLKAAAVVPHVVSRTAGLEQSAAFCPLGCSMVMLF